MEKLVKGTLVSSIGDRKSLNLKVIVWTAVELTDKRPEVYEKYNGLAISITFAQNCQNNI